MSRPTVPDDIVPVLTLCASFGYGGRAVYREVGYALVHAGGAETIDEVVFGEPGDTILLGARSLEGLNLRVDARAKRLVDAGPMPAMAT